MDHGGTIVYVPVVNCTRVVLNKSCNEEHAKKPQVFVARLVQRKPRTHHGEYPMPILSETSPAAALEQLQTNGYCILREMLDAEILERTRRNSVARIAALDSAHLESFRAAGTMIDSIHMPEFAE